MKKLTWALLSLMLFFGMGTAFADEGETSATTVPAPSFANVGEVAQGDALEIDWPTTGLDGYLTYYFILYVENDNTTKLEWSGTMSDLMAAAQPQGPSIGGPLAEGDDDDPAVETPAFKIAVYDADEEDWMPSVTLSELGSVNVRACMAVGKKMDEALDLSAEFTATYTVKERPLPNAPTFLVNGKELEGSTVELEAGEKAEVSWSGYEEGLQQYTVVYTTDGDESVFEAENMTDLPDEANFYYFGDEAIEVEAPKTVKAAVAEADMSTYDIRWSDIVTVTFTVKGGNEPVPGTVAAPVFNPNGGVVTLDQQISLSTTTEDATIYYTMDMPGESMPDFSVIKTEEELGEATMFMPYDDKDKITLGDFGVSEEDLTEGDAVVPLMAAAAVIDGDGNITWSTTTKATFTVKGSETPGEEVAYPVITPNDAEVHVGDLVTITCATEGAKIYYTLDGSDPADGNNWPMEYSEPFAISGYAVPENGELVIRAAAVKGEKSATAKAVLMVQAEAPEFSVEAGEVAFGTVVRMDCEIISAKIYYTLDNTTPTEASAEYTYTTRIVLTKNMTVKAIAVLGQSNSSVVTAAYTVAPVENAELVLAPMQETTVGKNVNTGITFSDGTPESANWMQYIPAVVYYTTDGTTEPSKAAYEAQTDKENGAIKTVSVKWEEQGSWYGPVQDADGNLMALTFAEATHLKAIGYLMEDGKVILTTALYDQELGIKSEKNPSFSLADGTEIEEGDGLVIATPNPYPAKPDIEMPEDWDDEEGWAAYEAAWEEYNASIAEIPATIMYFSFDGTKPTKAAYDAQEADWDSEKPYSTYSVFKTEEGAGINIFFGKDEEGYYANVPAIDDVLSMGHGYDTIRFEGEFSVQVWAVTTEAGEGGGIAPYVAKAAGGEIPFAYGSDFVGATYTVKGGAVAAPVFSVKAGAVKKGTKVSIACETEGAVIYYTVDGSEPTAESTEYKEAIEINKAMTIKAIAVKGNAKSEVVAAAYTIDATANEGEELYGVSVYPNPSNGQFNLELPCAATVEVFMSNGMLYQRLTLSEGNATLNINRSGIYFLRITGEGRTSIKRLIVR